MARVAGVTVQSGPSGSAEPSFAGIPAVSPKLIRWEAVRPVSSASDELPLSKFSDEKWQEWLHVYALPVFEYATRWGRGISPDNWLAGWACQLLRDNFGRETELEIGKQFVHGKLGPKACIAQMEETAKKLRERSEQEIHDVVVEIGEGRSPLLGGGHLQDEGEQLMADELTEGRMDAQAKEETDEAGVFGASFVADCRNALATVGNGVDEQEGVLATASYAQGSSRERKTVTVSVDRESGQYNGTALRRLERGAAAYRAYLHDESSWVTGVRTEVPWPGMSCSRPLLTSSPSDDDPRREPWIGDATTSVYLDKLPMPGHGVKPSERPRLERERRAFVGDSDGARISKKSAGADPGAWRRFAGHLDKILRKSTTKPAETSAAEAEELQEKRRVLFRLLLKVHMVQTWFLSSVLQGLPDRGGSAQALKQALVDQENTKMLAAMRGVSELLYRLVFSEVKKMMAVDNFRGMRPRLIPVREGIPYYGVYVVPSSFYQTDFRTQEEQRSLLLLPIELLGDTSGEQKMPVSPGIWAPAERRAEVLSAPSASASYARSSPQQPASAPHVTHKKEKREAVREDRKYDKVLRKKRAEHGGAMKGSDVFKGSSIRVESYFGSAGLQNLQLLQTVADVGSPGELSVEASVRMVDERALSVHLFCPYSIYRTSLQLVPNDEALALEYVTELLGASDLDEDRGSLATGVRASMLRDLPWWPDFIDAWGRAREAEAAELMREGGYWYGTSATHDLRRFPKYGCEDQKGRGQKAKCIALGVVRPGLQPRDPQRSFSMGAGDLAQARVLGHEHEMIELVKRMADAKLAQGARDLEAERAYLKFGSFCSGQPHNSGQEDLGNSAWLGTDRGAQLLYPHLLGSALYATVVFSLDFPKDCDCSTDEDGSSGQEAGGSGTATSDDKWTARLHELAILDLTKPVDVEDLAPDDTSTGRGSQSPNMSERAANRKADKLERQQREAFYPFASLEELEAYMREKMAEKLNVPQDDVEVFPPPDEAQVEEEGPEDSMGGMEVEDPLAADREYYVEMEEFRGRKGHGVRERHVVIDRDALRQGSAVASAFEGGTASQVWGKWEEEVARLAGTQFHRGTRNIKATRAKASKLREENKTAAEQKVKEEKSRKQGGVAEVARRQRARQQVIVELQRRTSHSRHLAREILTTHAAFLFRGSDAEGGGNAGPVTLKVHGSHFVLHGPGMAAVTWSAIVPILNHIKSRTMHFFCSLVVAGYHVAFVGGVTLPGGGAPRPESSSVRPAAAEPSRGGSLPGRDASSSYHQPPTPKLIRWEAVRPLFEKDHTGVYSAPSKASKHELRPDDWKRPLSEFSEEKWQEWLYTYALPVFEYATRWGHEVPGDCNWLYSTACTLMRDKLGCETGLEVGKQVVSGKLGPTPIIAHMEAQVENLRRSSDETVYAVAIQRGSDAKEQSCQDGEDGGDPSHRAREASMMSVGVDDQQDEEAALGASFVRDVRDALAGVSGEDVEVRGRKFVTVVTDRQSGRYTGTARRRAEQRAAALREVKRDEASWITGQELGTSRGRRLGLLPCSRLRSDADRTVGTTNRNKSWREQPWIGDSATATYLEHLRMAGPGDKPLECAKVSAERRAFAAAPGGSTASTTSSSSKWPGLLGMPTSSTDPDAWQRFTKHLGDILRMEEHGEGTASDEKDGQDSEKDREEMLEKRRVLFRLLLKVNMNQTAALSKLVRVVDMSVKQKEWVYGYLSPETRKKMEVQGGEIGWAETQKVLQILERENTKMLAAMQGVSELLYRLVFEQVSGMAGCNPNLAGKCGGVGTPSQGPSLIPVSGDEGANPYYGVYVVPSSVYETDFQKRSSTAAGKRPKEPRSLLLLPIELVGDRSGAQKMHVSPGIWAPAVVRSVAAVLAGVKTASEDHASSAASAAPPRPTATRAGKKHVKKADQKLEKRTVKAGVKPGEHHAGDLPRNNQEQEHRAAAELQRAQSNILDLYLGSAGLQNLQLLQSVVDSRFDPAAGTYAERVRMVTERALAVHLFCPYRVYLQMRALGRGSFFPDDERQAVEYGMGVLGASALDEDRKLIGVSGVRGAEMLRQMPWWPEFLTAWRNARETEADAWARGLGEKSDEKAGECIALGVVRPGLRANDRQRSFSMGAGDLTKARVLPHTHEMIELVKRMADAKIARGARDIDAELVYWQLRAQRQSGAAGVTLDPRAREWFATDSGAQVLFPHVFANTADATLIFSLEFPEESKSAEADKWTARLNELALQDFTQPLDEGGVGEEEEVPTFVGEVASKVSDRAANRRAEKLERERRAAFYPFESLEELEAYMKEKMAEKLDLREDEVDVFPRSGDLGGEGETEIEMDVEDADVKNVRGESGQERHVAIDMEALAQGSGPVAEMFQRDTPRQVWGKWEEEAARLAQTHFGRQKANMRRRKMKTEKEKKGAEGLLKEGEEGELRKSLKFPLREPHDEAVLSARYDWHQQMKSTRSGPAMPQLREDTEYVDENVAELLEPTSSQKPDVPRDPAQ
eukprot:g1921.t1